MNTFVLFAKNQCAEFSVNALLGEISAHYKEGISKNDLDTPLADQLKLIPNTITPVGNSISALISNTKPVFYSTRRMPLVRIGASARNHIQLTDTYSSMIIGDGILTIIDNTDIYLNGIKAVENEYPLCAGDGIWIGSTHITIHNGYIECSGEHYASQLNISTITPEKHEEFPIYKRSPRIIKRTPTDSVELMPPQSKEERKKGELIKIIIPPLTMMFVTVAVGMLMGRGIFMLVSAAGMTVSLITSITTFIGDRKERRKKDAERVENYSNYLLSQRKRIYTLYEEQRESLLYHYLSPKEIEREIISYSSRLYERSSNDSDFITLSLGYSTLSASYKLKYSAENIETDNDPLITEMRQIGIEYQTVPDLPAVIDLKNAHLGLVGEKVYIHRQLTSIIMQMCFYQSYHDIEIVLLVEEEDRPQFEWTRWYPHCRIKSINVFGLVSAENQRDQVLGNIAQMLKMRRQKSTEEKKDSRYLPHYIFIIDNPKLIINHSIMEYLQTPETSLGFSIIYSTHIRANLPENIKTVFMLDGGDHGNLLMNEGHLQNRSVTVPSVDDINLESMSRTLAPIKHTQGISTQIPESVTFFELYKIKRPEELPIISFWNKNACHKSLAVPLGLRGHDDVVLLNLHEKAHGPHGLVAGTTGSGKSEIIQSYILSLAVNFHPHEVGFLLIDYKGGGMANLFSNLPHLLGTITNLDGSESMRALASIKSELARRQRVFNDNGVNNINQYTKLFKAGEADLPLPHLFIISDEFAELKKEQPDFMSELVSAARIGRSLGVHLILATQKPSGVVDDQIWSNSKFKLALKVANESDSNEVLKTPDAARITQPGRSYLQVGNNEIYELFQSAWSGASYSEEIIERGFDSRVYQINQLGQGVLLNEDLSIVDKSEDSKLTQLDVLVNHVQSLYRELGAAIVDRPWLPPLDQNIVTPHIKMDVDVGKINTYNLSVAIGIADIPEEQRQTEYLHNFLDDGNFAVFSASGFGKSTVVMNIAITLASRNSPALLNYFILDFGNSALTQLRNLPHTADYIGFDDTEKLDKLVKLLTEELKKRKHLFASVNAINFRMYNEVAEKISAIIVVIDNYDVIREVSPDLEEFLIKLTRDGTGVGIYTIITASRSNAVRYSVLNNFKNKLSQFMFDPSDITAIVGRSTYKLTEVRGRALVKMSDVHVMQCYLPMEYEDDITYARLIGEAISQIDSNNTGRKAMGVRMLPDTVTYLDLEPFLRVNEKQAILGFDPENTEPLYLDLSITSQTIVGGSMTGKTNILRLLLTQFSGEQIFVADSRAYDLQDCENEPNVTYMANESQLDMFYTKLNAEVEKRQEIFQAEGGKIRDFLASQPPVLVLIDDGDNFIELCKLKMKEIETLLPKAKDIGICFIVTTLPSKLRGFDNLTKTLKDTQTGIALGHPGEQSLLPIAPPRGYKPVNDIAFWFKRGDVKQVKVPFIS